MSQSAVQPMTADAFLVWHEGQERRFELIDGVPVAMTGVRRRHDQVVANALFLLIGQLGVGRCRTFTADTAIRTPRGNIRYPDVGVDCGRFIDEAREADAPLLVIEVLSETNRVYDFQIKLEEYKSVPSLRHMLLVDTETPEILHWSRADGGAWSVRTVEGEDAVLKVDDLLTIPLRALYAGLEFRPRPKLVEGT